MVEGAKAVGREGSVGEEAGLGGVLGWGFWEGELDLLLGMLVVGRLLMMNLLFVGEEDFGEVTGWDLFLGGVGFLVFELLDFVF